MREGYRYTVADVQRSYTPEKRWSEMEGDLPSFLLYRRLSMAIAPMALRLRISHTAVSLLGLALALAMPLVAWWGGPYAFVVVAAMAFSSHVLDCLDGDLARTTGRASRFGELLDGFCDLVFWSAYFLSMGLLVERAGSSLFGQQAVPLALGLVILVLLHRQLRDAYATLYHERVGFTPYPPPALSAWAVLRMSLIGLEGAYLFGLLVAGALGALDVLLAAIAVYVVAIFVGAVGLTFSKAAEKDEP